MPNEFSRKIQDVHNFESLVDFLRDSLNWPIPDEGLKFDDITYDWPAEDLELDPNTQTRIVSCRQLQLYNLKFDLSAVSRQSNAESRTERALTTEQQLFAVEQLLANVINKLHEEGVDAETIASKIDMDLASVSKILKPWGIFFIEFADDVELDACRTLLRRVLRGLVDRPNRSSCLPFWDYDKLLFICTTTNFQNIGFACFSGEKSRPIVDDYIPLHYFRLNS